MVKVIVTGGCGFIGHHFCEHLFLNTNWDIIILDKLSYATKGFERLRGANLLNQTRVKIFTCDLTVPISSGIRQEIGKDVTYIVHMAAETHVDNSISEPIACVNNNVGSTLNLLEYARSLPALEKFFYFSTDEVYGSAPKGVAYKEEDRQRPTNPYSASKSAGEALCIAWHNTFKVPIIIVNCMNAFGEQQHTEKFVPKIMKYLTEEKELEIHSYPDCKTSGSRFYIHARNIAAAVMFLMEKGQINERYNIVGEKEVTNLEMAEMIARIMGKPLKYKLVNFHQDRPGHDLRYCLDGEKMAQMGWKLPVNFEESLRRTVFWTMKHPEWLVWE